MKVKEKYAEVINVGNALGITDLRLREQDGVLFIDGTAPSEDIIKKMWDTVAKIDSDHRAGDLMMNIRLNEMTGDASPEKKSDSDGYTEDIEQNVDEKK